MSSPISRDVAIIMLATAVLGVIGVFPLISSALIMAQAVLWLQQGAATKAIRNLVIFAIVFACIELIVLVFALGFALEYPACNYNTVFGADFGQKFRTYYPYPGASFPITFNDATNVCGGWSAPTGPGSSSDTGGIVKCINGKGDTDGIFLWILVMTSFNFAICVVNIAWSILVLRRTSVESAAALADVGNAYAQVSDGMK